MGTDQVSDEQIFRRKLLMDGEGMGDEKRITNVMKNLIKFINPELSQEEKNKMHVGTMAMIDTCSFAMAKSALMQNVNEDEIENYDKMEKHMDFLILEAEKDNAMQKLALIEAKRIRKNKQQYQNLMTLIKEQPDSKDTLAKLKILQGDIDELERTRNNLSANLEKKLKLFHRLSTSVFEIKALFQGNEDMGEGNKQSKGISTPTDETPMDVTSPPE